MIFRQEDQNGAQEGYATDFIGFGKLRIVRETYPRSVTDSKTGFTVKAGHVVMLHFTDVPLKLGRDTITQTRSELLASAREVALALPALFEADTMPDQLIAATHRRLARLALLLGLAYFLPEQSIITDSYRKNIKDLVTEYARRERRHIESESGDPADLEAVDDRVCVLHMPMQLFLDTYGSNEPPTHAQITDLRKSARAMHGGCTARVEAAASEVTVRPYGWGKMTMTTKSANLCL